MARVQSKKKKVTHLLDDHHSELHGERMHVLTPPSFQHCANSFEKPRGLLSGVVGSSSEHEQFCTTRSSFEAPGEHSNGNEGAKTTPTEFYIGTPGRPGRMRKLVALAVVLERTHIDQGLSLDQVEEQGGSATKAVADDLDDDSDSYPETCIQKTENKQSQIKLKACRARRRTRVHSDLLKSGSTDTMLVELAVTTRPRMQYSQSRERLFCSTSQNTQ